uniref:Uncharacterized protein n=1 Tax=Actinobacteria phage HS02 TaxID=3056388 RepID=A0AA50ACW0_9VIRU|nr:MAG: hypothetical protein [Actinobacteria phage HS02]
MTAQATGVNSYPKGGNMVIHPMKQGTYTVSSGYGPRWGT